MSITPDVTTLARARGSFASDAEIDEFVVVLGRFERGEISADEWRKFRTIRGVYSQRQTDDAQMLRVKIPQGLLTAAQLDALADVAQQYSRGFGHITTRQNLQLHFIRLGDTVKAMRRLGEAGLTTREACGNAVRNITCCPYAGVAADELFDVTPYAEALTRHLLRHPLSSTLPRKFKIALEGCSTDHAALAVNDLGFRARVAADGTRGFRVTVGGGTSILCTPARLLHDFVPATEVLRVAEAVLRVFHRLGDYEHKRRNRLKFLIRELGWDQWRAEYERELEACRAEGAVPAFDNASPASETQAEAQPDGTPSIETIAQRVGADRFRGPGLQPVVVPVLGGGDEAFTRWRTTNVQPQKQSGFAMATASVPLGDLGAEQMRVIGALARAFGDGSVRVTIEQNLVFRWISASALRPFYERLAAAGLGLGEAGTIADVTSCPGAESCRLGVTQSRGLARLVEQHLRDRPGLIAAADGARIKISGCPSGCGQHHIATIGFQGSVRLLGSRVVPQYFLMVGGGITDAGASFARLAAKIPARRIPAAIERLLALYTAERRPGESAPDFFARVEVERVRAALGSLAAMTEGEVTPADFVDLGEAAQFQVKTLEGECAV